MADWPDLATLDLDHIGGAQAAITTLARTHGISAEPEPIDAFVDAAARLVGTEVPFDRTERLLLGLARAGVITDDQRFALHVAYLQHRQNGVRSVR